MLRDSTYAKYLESQVEEELHGGWLSGAGRKGNAELLLISTKFQLCKVNKSAGLLQ